MRAPSVRTALERCAASAAGRAVISVGVLVTVGAMLAANLPASQLQRDLGRVAQPYVNAVGIGQDWGIFSRPRELSAYVYARVDYADGTSSVVNFPSGRGLDGYVDYRWQKFEEWVRPDAGRRLWDPLARYVAERAREGGREPVRVALVRRWADTERPGPGPQRAPWREYTFYVLTVGPSR